MADDPEDRDPLTITEAAERAGVARSTIRRALDRDDFPNAARDEDDPRGTWLIPTADLDEAGYGADRGTPQGAPDADGGATSSADGGVQQGAAMVPLDTFRELFQHIANAEARAAKAEAELAFLRERMAAREDDAEDDGTRTLSTGNGAIIGVLATIGVGALGLSFAVPSGAVAGVLVVVAGVAIGVTVLSLEYSRGTAPRLRDWLVAGVIVLGSAVVGVLMILGIAPLDG